MSQYPKLIAIIIALLVFVGGEYVSASVYHRELVATVLSDAAIPAAELDPVFQQKLVQRIRGPYERSHPTNGVASR